MGLDNFFITDYRFAEVETGSYQIPLVVLSYIVACVASFTALTMAVALTGTHRQRERLLFHWGGAFAMGAGIWSMHFIGMLSYKMRMALDYDPFVTFLSMVIAIIASWFALGLVAGATLPRRRLFMGGVLMGLGICAMHYTGMAAMKMDADLRYTPGVFLLSVLIAIGASIAALWISFRLSRRGSAYRPFIQGGAALVMGAAICGMHYTGMAASVFIPRAGCRYAPDQDFTPLAIAVAATTALILCVTMGLAVYARMQAEKRLQSSETRLHAVIETALDAVIAMDDSGIIIDWNHQAETMFGWPRDEALGRALAETIIPQEQRLAHHIGMERYLSGGAGPILNRRIEVTALHRSGRYFPVELAVTAQMVDERHQFTAFVRDITERREGERNTALLAAIVQSSEDAMISKTLDGTITSWNKGAERLYGYTADEAIGQSIMMIVPPDRVTEEKDILARLAEGKSIEHFETERVRKDGKHIAISLTISPIHDRAGNVVGASKVARDITERKAAEAELMRYMKALERSNQELDDFAHIASHDLKEPLRGLVIQANFLIEDYNNILDDAGKHRLSRLMQLSQRMERLVSDLLYFSQLGRAELAVQETDLNVVIDEMRQMLEQFLKDRNGYITVPKPLPLIVCDKPRIAEALRNLITNAIKYNDKDERVAEVGFLDAVDTPEGRETHVFYVRDNGVGIAPEFHKEVFRIFRRLKQSGDEEPGTGVGLTFVKKIIERHLGRIWLDSTPGQGTVFYFTLKQGDRF